MFPVETISAKMLDYYVGRRDTLIIDLREYEPVYLQVISEINLSAYQ